MKNSEILEKYLKENDMSKQDLSYRDAEEMMETWLELEYNQMPCGDFENNFELCVKKAMWNIRQAEAICVFAGNEFMLNVPSYKWCIEQAIINRKGGPMISAALDYVNNLLSRDYLCA